MIDDFDLSDLAREAAHERRRHNWSLRQRDDDPGADSWHGPAADEDDDSDESDLLGRVQ